MALQLTQRQLLQHQYCAARWSAYVFCSIFASLLVHFNLFFQKPTIHRRFLRSCRCPVNITQKVACLTDGKLLQQVLSSKACIHSTCCKAASLQIYCKHLPGGIATNMVHWLMQDRLEGLAWHLQASAALAPVCLCP